MKDSDKTSLAIVFGGLLISGAIIWVGSTKRHDQSARSAADGQSVELMPKSDAPGEPPTPQETISPRSDEALPTAPSQQDVKLDQEMFLSAWDPQYAALAGEKCFEPIDRRGDPINSTPYFNVVVEADGMVSSVSYEPGAEERFGRLYPCVADVIKTITFPAPDRRIKGNVQANRPGAFVPMRQKPENGAR